MSQQLGNKFDHFAETVLPSLTNLIPNSAKVMATAGIVTIRFIIQVRVNLHRPTPTPISCANITTMNLNGTELISGSVNTFTQYHSKSFAVGVIEP